jgi:hypothetical protein
VDADAEERGKSYDARPKSKKKQRRNGTNGNTTPPPPLSPRADQASSSLLDDPIDYPRRRRCCAGSHPALQVQVSTAQKLASGLWVGARWGSWKT